ncbi:hypothetical protein B0T14DRAFT_299977 [Immersiella caudata]|uniref:Uncharacterized protein n=1 Tax=Immersiella caudata TaxID=314043 RepID=A0AA39WF34_9PEZI|nr:hypothetical protein B0T14DRAFT_299977 [Immersiella caudata]
MEGHEPVIRPKSWRAKRGPVSPASCSRPLPARAVAFGLIHPGSAPPRVWERNKNTTRQSGLPSSLAMRVYAPAPVSRPDTKGFKDRPRTQPRSPPWSLRGTPRTDCDASVTSPLSWWSNQNAVYTAHRAAAD